MTPRDKQNARHRWRRNSKTFRSKRKLTNNLITPPNSSGSEEDHPYPQPQPNQENRRSSLMKITLSRKRKREMAKCYRQNATIKIKLNFQERLTEKHKKRFNQMNQKFAQRTLSSTRNKKNIHG